PVTYCPCPLSLSVSSFSSFSSAPHLRPPHSFPTRRSSDLTARRGPLQLLDIVHGLRWDGPVPVPLFQAGRTSSTCRSGRHATTLDRKSTRLNSSHGSISYAVFCLKKKNKNT